MQRLIVYALLLAVLVIPAHADVSITGGGGNSGAPPPDSTVAGLGTCDATLEGARRRVTDATTEATCTSGGGALKNHCTCQDGAWQIVGAGGAVSDGTKEDIVVSGSGTIYNIVADKVTAAEIATGAVASSEISDGTVAAIDLGADSVGASELDATAVSAEIAATLTLSALAGAVTDAQVPDTITVNRAITVQGVDGDNDDCLEVKQVAGSIVFDTNDDCLTDHAMGVSGSTWNSAHFYSAKTCWGGSTAAASSGIWVEGDHLFADVNCNGTREPATEPFLDGTSYPQLYTASYLGVAPTACALTGDVHIDSDSGAYWLCTDQVTDAFTRLAGLTSKNFWVSNDVEATLVNTNCLLHGPAHAGTVAMACNSSSNALETGAYFAPGQKVWASKLACTTQCTGCTAAQTIQFGIRWRKGDAVGTMTDDDSTVTITPASLTSGNVVAADINSLCPYSASGCVMSVNIEAEGLTTGTGVDVNCEVTHAVF